MSGKLSNLGYNSFRLADFMADGFHVVISMKDLSQSLSQDI